MAAKGKGGQQRRRGLALCFLTESGHLTPPGPSRDAAGTRRGTARMIGLNKQTNEAFQANSHCQNTPATLKPPLHQNERSSKCAASQAALSCSISDQGRANKTFTNKVLQELTALGPFQALTESHKNPLLTSGVPRKRPPGAKPEEQDQNAHFGFVSPKSCFFLWRSPPRPPP